MKSRYYLEFALQELIFKEDNPSKILSALKNEGILSYIPELAALCSCPQDPVYHPEGDVFTHTILTLDAAADYAKSLGNDDRAKCLILAALFHDIAKPLTTRYFNGKLHAFSHDLLGEIITQRILEKLNFHESIIKNTKILVKFHLFPLNFFYNRKNIKMKSIRKLSRECDIELLLLLAEADHKGRFFKNDDNIPPSDAVEWLRTKIEMIIK